MVELPEGMVEKEVPDAEDTRDALDFLQGFTWEVRSRITDDVRQRMAPYGDQREPSESEVENAIGAAVASELQNCGKKLATLLLKGLG